MLKKLFVSLQQNIKLKTTNPFLGAFFIVWFIRNWKFIYSLFTLNTFIPIGERFKILEVYLKSESYLLELIFCIGLALLLIITTYFFLNVSRYIINIYEKRLTPWIYKISDYDKLVPIDDYNNICVQRDRNEKKYEDERDRRLKLQGEYDNLERKQVELVKELENKKIGKIEIQEKEDKKEKIETPIGEYKFLADDLANKIIEDKELSKYFNTLIINIAKDSWFERTSVKFNYFLNTGIIESGQRSKTNIKLIKFIFTPIGEEVKKVFISNQFTDDISTR